MPFFDKCESFVKNVSYYSLSCIVGIVLLAIVIITDIIFLHALYRVKISIGEDYISALNIITWESLIPCVWNILFGRFLFKIFEKY